MTSPPFPPSPPSGPLRGTHASRRKETQPSPPSPALILIFASSRNMGRRGYLFGPQLQGRLLVARQGGREPDHERPGGGGADDVDGLGGVSGLRQDENVFGRRKGPRERDLLGAVGKRLAVDE